MPDASVSFAGNLTDDPELRHTDGGIARATFRVAVSGRREGEPSFFTVVVWRDQAEHAAASLIRGSRVVVVWSAPAADVDGRGWQHPVAGRGRCRGAGAEPAVGDAEHDQGDEAALSRTRCLAVNAVVC
jgi:Single-strand binding protein family